MQNATYNAECALGGRTNKDQSPFFIWIHKVYFFIFFLYFTYFPQRIMLLNSLCLIQSHVGGGFVSPSAVCTLICYQGMRKNLTFINCSKAHYLLSAVNESTRQRWRTICTLLVPEGAISLVMILSSLWACRLSILPHSFKEWKRMTCFNFVFAITLH